MFLYRRHQQRYFSFDDLDGQKIRFMELADSGDTFANDVLSFEHISYDLSTCVCGGQGVPPTSPRGVALIDDPPGRGAASRHRGQAAPQPSGRHCASGPSPGHHRRVRSVLEHARDATDASSSSLPGHGRGCRSMNFFHCPRIALRCWQNHPAGHCCTAYQARQCVGRGLPERPVDRPVVYTHHCVRTTGRIPAARCPWRRARPLIVWSCDITPNACPLRDCSYVDQDPSAIGTQTVREMLLTSARLRLPEVVTDQQRKERIQALAVEFGIEHILDRRFGEVGVCWGPCVCVCVGGGCCSASSAVGWCAGRGKGG